MTSKTSRQRAVNREVSLVKDGVMCASVGTDRNKCVKAHGKAAFRADVGKFVARCSDTVHLQFGIECSSVLGFLSVLQCSTRAVTLVHRIWGCANPSRSMSTQPIRMTAYLTALFDC